MYQKGLPCVLFLFIIASTASATESLQPARIVSAPLIQPDTGILLYGPTLEPRPAIEGLTWSTLEPRVQMQSEDGGVRYTASIQGQFKQEDWSVLIDGSPISPDKDGNFKKEITFTKERLAFDLVGVGPRGEATKDTLHLEFLGWLNEEETKKEIKRYYISPGLGFTQLTQTQSKVADYSSTNLTVKINGGYILIPNKWDLGLSVYLTALQLAKSRDVSARYYGYNLRAGYTIPEIPRPWKLMLSGGFYYTTMQITPGRDPATGATYAKFGYQQLAGPQLYPSARYTLDSQDMIGAYLKYSPIASGLNLLTPSNRELAVGVQYIHPLEEGRSISGTLDFSNIYLVLDNPNIAGDKITLTTTSVSLGASYGF